MKKKKIIYFNAPITLTFVFLCLVALGINYLTNGRANSVIFSTYHSSILDPIYYIRLITHIFGHANITHLLNNMMYILLLGPVLEEKYGKKLIIVIVFTAIVTAITHNIISKNTALLGASGIVFSFILLTAFTGKKEGIPITFILVGLLYIGGEIVSMANVDSISQLAHIVGGLCGAIMAYFLK